MCKLINLRLDQEGAKIKCKKLVFRQQKVTHKEETKTLLWVGEKGVLCKKNVFEIDKETL